MSSFKRSRRPRLSSSLRSFRPLLEELENRLAPAAVRAAVDSSFLFQPSTSSLSILGPTSGATAELASTSHGGVEITLNGQVYSSDTTSPHFDAALAGVVAANLRSVSLSGGGTADSLVLNQLTTAGDLSVNTDGGIVVAGAVTSAGQLSLSSTGLTVTGSAHAHILQLNSSSIDVEASGSLTAQSGSNGGAIQLYTNDFTNLGQVHADGAKGGVITIQTSDVMNAGTLSASGSAGAGGSIHVAFLDSYIETASAHTSATGKAGAGGQVTIDGGASGRLFTSGQFSATGTSGGHVDLFGQDVILESATVSASGLAGNGGQIRVGGDVHGSNPTTVNAQTVEITGATMLHADAAGTGSGGRVVVWSEVETDYAGDITAHGSGIGKGGAIEISSGGLLKDDGTAEAGAGGKLLLDPKNLIIDANVGVAPQFSLIDPGTGNGVFGAQVLTLANGNIVVTDPKVNNSTGAVYLFNGQTGALISTLSGSTAGDKVGFGGVVALKGTSNFVVSSPNWNKNIGAATWVNGTTGINGTISAANSLIGTTAGDLVGSQVIALGNGNYVVASPNWNGVAIGGSLRVGAPTVVHAVGAVTVGNGSTGISGSVSASNSLVGSTSGDMVGSNVILLSTGAYVVSSPHWNGNRGAVTFPNSGSGVSVGVVSSSNSLVGTLPGDQVGSGGVVSTGPGNVVLSPNWSNGMGAVTVEQDNVMPGNSSGAVSANNSLVGSTPGDRVGTSITPYGLTGDYVIGSPNWNNGMGAATPDGGFRSISGSPNIQGAVTAANSLIGSKPGDQVGTSITAVGYGYVVGSPNWNFGVGAATLGGNSGIFGAVTASNSLIGSLPGDHVGANVVALAGGKAYVVASPNWNYSTGAVTWGNATTGGIIGTVSAANSLVGSSPGDQVGLSVTALASGDYVVGSPYWSAFTGAATFGNGTTGTVGVVSSSNSLVGNNPGDYVGLYVTAVGNGSGNYVVDSPYWYGSRGAATFGTGSSGVSGFINVFNSLIGNHPNDLIGSSGTFQLANGNYVVTTSTWNGNTGAVTWGSGTTGVKGIVSSANSLVGNNGDDAIGSSITLIPSGVAGDYVVNSPNYAGREGAITYISGLNGATFDGTNTIDPQNSIIGASTFAGLTANQASNNYVASFIHAAGGAVDVGITSAGQIGFSTALSQTITLAPSFLALTLDAGTDVNLQASNDITINSPITVTPTAKAGNLTIDAGRSIIINGSINTGGGALTLIANDTVARGVVNSQRDPGPANINMAAGVVLNAGNNLLTVDVATSTDKTNNTSGVTNLQLLVANTVALTGSTNFGVIVNGSSPGDGVTAGTYTQSNITGSINLNGATLSVTRIANIPVKNTLTIIHTSGGITGTFQGLAEGATFTSSDGSLFSISYQGNGGKDVVLTAEASPTQLVVTQQPRLTIQAGSGFTFSITAEDNSGNVAAKFNGMVTIALGANPGGSTLGGTLTVQAVNGVATFSGITLNRIGTGYTIVATSGSLAPATTASLTVVAGLPAQLVVTTEPPTSVTAGTTFGLSVSAEDVAGNLTPYSGFVTVAIAANPGNDTLGGMVIVDAVNGVANFTDLSLIRAATGYTLQATSGSLTAGLTTPITVTAGAASELVVTTQPPTSVIAGTGFGATVSAVDTFGNVDTTFTGKAVTVSLSANPGNDTLGGTLTALTTNGVATFSGLSLHLAASGYTLGANSTGLSSTTSNAISVTAGAAIKLAVTTQPPATVTAGIPFGMAVSAEDSFGNVDTTYTGIVVALAFSSPFVTQKSSVAAVKGVATFTDILISRAFGSGQTIPVTSGSLTPTTTSAFTVVAGAPTGLGVITQPPASISAGSPFTVAIGAFDNLSNLNLTYTGLVTIALSNNPGNSTLGGTLTVAAVNGVATFTNLTLNRPGVGYTLTVTSADHLAPNTTDASTVVVGPASQVAVTTQPSNSVTAGSSFGLAATVEDIAGNVVTGFSGNVTLSIGTNPGGGTLSGTLTAAAVNGVATFSGLSLNKSGVGYTILASSGTLTQGTSNAITVVAGAATQLAVTTQPPTGVIAGSPFGMAISGEDSFGNVSTTFNGTVSLALAANPGSATLGGNLSITAVNGVATFSGLSLNKIASGYTIQASSGSLTSATTGTILVSAAPTKVVVTTQPSSTVGAGAGFSVIVSAEDGLGNLAAGYQGNVTIALANNPGNSTLGGTLTVAAVNGVATFSGLTLNHLGAGYTLLVTSGALTSATTNSFTVIPGPASQLLITAQPPNSVTAAIGFSMSVSAEDSVGNVATGFSGPVTISIGTNAGGSTLGGTITVNAVNGVATFPGLTLNKVGSNYTLIASSGTLTSATSTPLSVVAGAAAQLAFSTQPPNPATAGTGFGLTVLAQDSSGNYANTFSGSVTVSIGNNPGNSTLGGIVTVSAINGIATFSGLTLNKVATGYTLKASAASLTAGTSSAFSVIAGAATQLVVTTQPPGSVTAVVGFGLAVSAEDSSGNVATTYGNNVTLSLGANPGSSTLGGTLTVTAVNGVATFSGLTLNKVGTGYTLKANDGSLTQGVSGAFNVIPGAATQLAVMTQPPNPATAAVGFGLAIDALDVAGNVATGFNGGVTVALAANPGSSTLGGTLTVTATNGVASFSGLTLNKVATGYTLSATSGTLTPTTTNAFNVIPGAATTLTVTTQPPTTVTAGINFGLAVTAFDVAGNLATGFSGNVTMVIGTNPGGSTIGGTFTVAASAGVATFSALTLNKVGTGYTLTATSTGLSPSTTTNFNVIAGVATQLAVNVQPPSPVTAGAGFGLSIKAEDSSGNLATTFAGPITVAIGTNPGGSTLSGTLTATASGGIATFSGLSLNKSGVGYTLAATSGSLTATATTGFNVVAAAATQLVVTSQPPSSVAAAVGFGMTISAEDTFGNVDTTYSGNVALALAANPGPSTLGGTTTVAAVNGVATYSGLTLNKVATGYTIQATAAGLTPITTSSIAVVPGVATQLLITAQPPSNVTAGFTFGIAVTAEDSSGNVATNFSNNVSLAIGNNPGGSTLGGTTTVAAVNGVATFFGLTLNKVGTGYTLVASSGTLTTATTSTIKVNAGVTAQLQVTTQPPASNTAGVGFGLAVTAEDNQGNPTSSFSGNVTLAIGTNPGSSTLSGTTTVMAVNGVATFAGLSLNKTGTGYTLVASSGALTSGTSAAFNIVAAAATHLVVTAQPPSPVTAGGAFGLAVSAEDAFGNVDLTYSSNVSAALGNNPGGSTLSGTTTIAAVNGVATFAGLSLNKSGNGYTLTTTSGSFSSVTTSAFNVVAGTATQLVITTQPPGSVTAGNGFGLVVTAEDSLGNKDLTYTSGVTIALSNNPGGSTLGGTTTVSAVAGVATFSGLTLNKVGTGYTLKLTSGALTAATTSGINVVAAAATTLIVTIQPNNTYVTLDLITVQITAVDNFGNTDLTFSGNVTAAIGFNAGGATLGGTLVKSAVNGVVTFTDLTLNDPGFNYTLEFSSGSLAPAITAQFDETGQSH